MAGCRRRRGVHCRSHAEPPPGVACAALPCTFPNASFMSPSNVLLFDLEADPTERNDLSSTQPGVRQQLMHRLEVYVNQSVPQDHGPRDPRSDPANFGGVWTPWIGDPNPAHCAKPPTPPRPACGGDGESGDGSVVLLPAHPGKCSASGWCAGPQFSGPARQAVVRIDGSVVAAGVANESRRIAGPKNPVTFDRAVLAHGKHTTTVGCKCAKSAEVQVLRGGTVCTVGPPARVVPCPT